MSTNYDGVYPNNEQTEKPVDVTLQDFNSLLKTRGTNGIVIESELMRKVMALAPILAKAYETLQNRPVGIRAMPLMPPMPKPQIVDY